MTKPERCCPHCDELRMGYFRYCLACAFDFDSLPPPDLPAIEVASQAPEIVATPTPAIAAGSLSLTGVRRPIAAMFEGPAPAVQGAFVPTGPTADPGAVGTPSPTVGPSSITRGRIARSVAIWVSAAVLVFMAISDMTTRSANPTPPAHGPDPSSVPTPAVRSPQPTSGSPLVITNNDAIEIVADSAERLSGAAGTHTWPNVAVATDQVIVSWDVSAGPDSGCRLHWQIQPSSTDVIEETIDVQGTDLVTGGARFDTPFTDAGFVVVTDCEQWEISLLGG